MTKTSPSTGVHLHARRVALVATVLALVVYLLACTIADLLVVDRLNGSINARLASRLVSLTHRAPQGLSPATSKQTPLPSSSDGDFDDAPILAWFVPSGATSAQRLESDAPTLPPSELRVSQPTTAAAGGRTFRIEGRAIRTGRLVVATSTQEATDVRNTLLIIEGVLAPILLLALFLAASIIGRRAATPIERARLRQLEFTADASHELRTPLSVIEAEIGLALSAERSAPAYRAALERVAGESKRLRSIVDDLLWLARLDAMPESPPQEAVDIASLVTACADRFSAVAQRDRLTISIAEKGTFSPIIVAPADWLDRLVSVLLDNACRYTDVGGQIEITVSSTEDKVLLLVDDNGPGIAEEQRDQIMQRFHRASDAPGGAGLGLSIANAVIRATDGEWSVSTAPIGGARIQVSWPRSRSDDADNPIPDDHRDQESADRDRIADRPSAVPIAAR
jgi:signal transduction histidine kinase